MIESFIRWLVAAILLRSCFWVLTQAILSFEKVVEVLRAMVASWVALCCPRTQTLSSVSHSVQPTYLVALHGGKGRCRSTASHVEHAGPRIIPAPRERQHHRLIEPRFHGDGCGSTGLGCYNDLEQVSVDLSQGETVFLSKQLAVTRTSGPRFQRPLARRTTMLSVRTGQCGAGSLYMWWRGSHMRRSALPGCMERSRRRIRVSDVARGCGHLV